MGHPNIKYITYIVIVNEHPSYICNMQQVHQILAAFTLVPSCVGAVPRISGKKVCLVTEIMYFVREAAKKGKA